ncbi:TRAP transporter small permease [Gulosibacter sp. 10]|uniref:TRAP transporter small permease n=1 Tax=Gulosibacter sp. 10 TaxID=1255570 RepID=UPI0020CBB05F|nr:TRAP transporter small permease [Gulosibacter sp. 10]
MERIVTAAARAMAVIAALCLVVLMLAITVDVVVRNITDKSLPGMIELAETSLVIAIFFGLGIAAVRGEHVAVTLLTDRLGKRAAQVCLVVTWAVTAVFLAWMAWASALRAVEATQRGEERFGLVRWPMWPLRWVILAGILMFLLVAILNLARTIRGREPLGARDEVELVAETLPEPDLAEVPGAAGEPAVTTNGSGARS